jgi:hypothetical protein
MSRRYDLVDVAFPHGHSFGRIQPGGNSIRLSTNHFQFAHAMLCSLIGATKQSSSIPRGPAMLPEVKTVSEAARPIFDAIKASLLPEHVNSFVSIEPESRDYFLGLPPVRCCSGDQREVS